MSFKKVNPNIINNTNRDREKFNSYRTEINSPFRNKLNNNFIEPNSNQSANNITERNLFNNNKNNLFNDLKVNNNNNYLLNKRNLQTRLYNNINNYKFNFNRNITPSNKRESIHTDTNLLQNKKYFQINNNNSNISNSGLSNNNNNSFSNENITYNEEKINNQFSNKIPITKDENIDYIEFLNKQFEPSPKNNSKLEYNNKELLKRCKDLIEDNRLLNSALNERTSKLNKIIQENILLKSQIETYKLNIQKK